MLTSPVRQGSVCVSVWFSYMGNKIQLAKVFWSKLLEFYHLGSINLISPKRFSSTGKDWYQVALK